MAEEKKKHKGTGVKKIETLESRVAPMAIAAGLAHSMTPVTTAPIEAQVQHPTAPVVPQQIELQPAAPPTPVIEPAPPANPEPAQPAQPEQPVQPAQPATTTVTAATNFKFTATFVQQDNHQLATSVPMVLALPLAEETVIPQVDGGCPIDDGQQLAVLTTFETLKPEAAGPAMVPAFQGANVLQTHGYGPAAYGNNPAAHGYNAMNF